jgi:nucleotide-binding universal stress UspA family protein
MNEQVGGGEKKGRRLKVLVAIDASEISTMVVKRSGQFAKVADCDLTVFSVIEDVVNYDNIPDTPLYQERKRKAEDILKKASDSLAKHGVPCRTKTAIGPIGAEIVRVAKEGSYDIIFVGSRGLGGIKRMLVGSVAFEVLQHAHCSVALVR